MARYGSAAPAPPAPAQRLSARAVGGAVAAALLCATALVALHADRGSIDLAGSSIKVGAAEVLTKWSTEIAGFDSFLAVRASTEHSEVNLPSSEKTDHGNCLV